MRRRRVSLRLRLSVGAGGLAALAILAAALAGWGVREALSLGEEAAGAQRRIDAYGTLSARITQVVLTPADQRLDAVGAVLDDFARLDQMIGTDVGLARGDAVQNRAAQGAALGRMRGAFLRLMEELEIPAVDPTERDAALNGFARMFAPLMRDQVEYNHLRRNEALAALDQLRQRMAALSVAVVVAVCAVLVILYLLVLAPLRARLLAATQAATLGPAEMRPTLLPGGAHDELGLLFGRINRMIARLDRRRAALAADRAALERVVADRTSALEAANARLARTDEDRRRFFADVSHELRTPLTVILAEAELAAAGCPPEAARSLATIRARAARLNRRIEDLLRIARSESGQLELDPRPTDLDATLDAAVEDLRPLLVRAGFTVERQSGTADPVEADPDWLRQILGGIVGNAVKHAGQGTTLRLSSGRDGGFGYCEITDDGPGLSPEGRAALATRFASGRDAGPGSFGIGLSLARWVTEAQGGTLAVTSPMAGGRGFAVRVALPLAAQAAGRLRASA